MRQMREGVEGRHRIKRRGPKSEARHVAQEHPCLRDGFAAPAIGRRRTRGPAPPHQVVDDRSAGRGRRERPDHRPRRAPTRHSAWRCGRSRGPPRRAGRENQASPLASVILERCAQALDEHTGSVRVDRVDRVARRARIEGAPGCGITLVPRHNVRVQVRHQVTKDLEVDFDRVDTAWTARPACIRSCQ
jgi:hypothetical protein